MVHRWSAGLSASRRTSDAGCLQAGIRFNLERLILDERIFQSRFRARDFGSGWSAGLLYTLRMKDDVFLRAGCCLDWGACFDARGSVSDPNGGLVETGVDPSITGNNAGIAALLQRDFPVRGRMPSIVRAGLSVGSESDVWMNLEGARFSEIETSEAAQSASEISGAAGCRIAAPASVSIGLLNRRLAGPESAGTGARAADAWFVTAGLVLRLGPVVAEIAYAGSRNRETSEFFRRNVFKAGLAFTF